MSQSPSTPPRGPGSAVSNDICTAAELLASFRRGRQGITGEAEAEVCSPPPLRRTSERLWSQVDGYAGTTADGQPIVDLTAFDSDSDDTEAGPVAIPTGGVAFTGMRTPVRTPGSQWSQEQGTQFGLFTPEHSPSDNPNMNDRTPWWWTRPHDPRATPLGVDNFLAGTPESKHK